MKKTVYACGLEAALAVLGGKWKLLVLWNLANGPKRFGELRRLVGGVTEKMLIQSLKEMVDDGLVVRKDYQEIPPHVEYTLSEWGTSLASACRPLCEWGVEHMERLTLSEDGPALFLSGCLNTSPANVNSD